MSSSKLSRSFVAAACFGNHQVTLIRGFHLCIVKSLGFAPCNPADLKPDEVICIVDNSHLVRFCVSDIHGRLYKIYFGSAFVHGIPWLEDRNQRSGDRIQIGSEFCLLFSVFLFLFTDNISKGHE